MLVQDFVQALRAFQVFAEWLFNHDAMQPARPIEADDSKIFGDRGELGRLDRQIEDDVGARFSFWLAKLSKQPLKSLDAREVARHVAEALGETVEQSAVELAIHRIAQRLFHMCTPCGVVVGASAVAMKLVTPGSRSCASR